MRKDMAKVIVERPRRGSEKRARKGRTRALEDDDGAPLRVRQSVTKPARTKYLNENLAPLRRFLEGQVGRPWDKVYAEISENLKPSSTVQQHVRDHIDDFVATNTRLIDGKVEVLGTRAFRGSSVLPLNKSFALLYVDPKSKLLRKNPHWRSWAAAARAKREAQAAARALRMRKIAPGVQLHFFGEVWWEVTLELTPRAGAMAYTDVVYAAKLSDLPPHELYDGYGVYAAKKRSLNKAEKKRLGL